MVEKFCKLFDFIHSDRMLMEVVRIIYRRLCESEMSLRIHDGVLLETKIEKIFRRIPNEQLAGSSKSTGHHASFELISTSNVAEVLFALLTVGDDVFHSSGDS